MLHNILAMHSLQGSKTNSIILIFPPLNKLKELTRLFRGLICSWMQTADSAAETTVDWIYKTNGESHFKLNSLCTKVVGAPLRDYYRQIFKK